MAFIQQIFLPKRQNGKGFPKEMPQNAGNALQRSPMDLSLQWAMFIESLVLPGTGGGEVYSFSCVSEVKFCVSPIPHQESEAREETTISDHHS